MLSADLFVSVEQNQAMIVLVISLCFLVGSIFYVIKSEKPEIKQNTMDVEYVLNNYEIDLYEEKNDNTIELSVSAKYIGNDEIKNDPEITLLVSCLYTYTDANETYTDILNDKLILKKTDNLLRGNMVFTLNHEVLDGYSCSYQVENVSGSYNLK